VISSTSWHSRHLIIFSLISANDDFFTVKVSRWRRPSIVAVVVPANDDFFSLNIIVHGTSSVALVPSDDYFFSVHFDFTWRRPSVSRAFIPADDYFFSVHVD